LKIRRFVEDKPDDDGEEHAPEALHASENRYYARSQYSHIRAIIFLQKDRTNIAQFWYQ
jgi:hypothetical protein